MDEKAKEIFGDSWPEFTEKLGVDSRDEEYLEARAVKQSKSSPWTDVAVWVAMLSLAMGSGALWWAWGLKTSAEKDRAWIEASSRKGQDWRVVVPPIEPNEADWRAIRIEVVAMDGDGNETPFMQELAQKIKERAAYALKQAGCAVVARSGSLLVIEPNELGHDYEYGLRMTLLGDHGRQVVWQQHGRREIEEEWVKDLYAAAKEGLAERLPDGTWELRVGNYSLPSGR